MNTHGYDGNWKQERDLIFEKDGLIEFDIDEVKAEIKIKYPHISSQVDMIKDYDIANDVDAQELLARVWRKAKKENEFDILCEQIEDVSNGRCAQGQTTRLFQVLSSFYDE